MKKALAIAAAALLTTAAHAGCYTVVDSKGLVLVESSTPPVDMQYQLHQTVQYRYGKGARLVFGSTDEDCGDVVDHTDGDGLKAMAKKAVAEDQARKAREAEKRAAAEAAAAEAAEAPASAASAAAAPAPAPAQAPASAADAASAPAQ
ncbi:MAG: hypothetical protein J6T92_05775 [Ottowia sp.]|nr:hypothetical protein [Ottowia sp.]